MDRIGSMFSAIRGSKHTSSQATSAPARCDANAVRAERLTTAVDSIKNSLRIEGAKSETVARNIGKHIHDAVKAYKQALKEEGLALGIDLKKDAALTKHERSGKNHVDTLLLNFVKDLIVNLYVSAPDNLAKEVFAEKLLNDLYTLGKGDESQGLTFNLEAARGLESRAGLFDFKQDHHVSINIDDKSRVSFGSQQKGRSMHLDAILGEILFEHRHFILQATPTETQAGENVRDRLRQTPPPVETKEQDISALPSPQMPILDHTTSLIQRKKTGFVAPTDTSENLSSKGGSQLTPEDGYTVLTSQVMRTQGFNGGQVNKAVEYAQNIKDVVKEIFSLPIDPQEPRLLGVAQTATATLVKGSVYGEEDNSKKLLVNSLAFNLAFKVDLARKSDDTLQELVTGYSKLNSCVRSLVKNSELLSEVLVMLKSEPYFTDKALFREVSKQTGTKVDIPKDIKEDVNNRWYLDAVKYCLGITEDSFPQVPIDEQFGQSGSGSRKSDLRLVAQNDRGKEKLKLNSGTQDQPSVSDDKRTSISSSHNLRTHRGIVVGSQTPVVLTRKPQNTPSSGSFGINPPQIVEHKQDESAFPTTTELQTFEMGGTGYLQGFGEESEAFMNAQGGSFQVVRVGDENARTPFYRSTAERVWLGHTSINDLGQDRKVNAESIKLIFDELICLVYKDLTPQQHSAIVQRSLPRDSSFDKGAYLKAMVTFLNDFNDGRPLFQDKICRPDIVDQYVAAYVNLLEQGTLNMQTVHDDMGSLTLLEQREILGHIEYAQQQISLPRKFDHHQSSNVGIGQPQEDQPSVERTSSQSTPIHFRDDGEGTEPEPDENPDEQHQGPSSVGSGHSQEQLSFIPSEIPVDEPSQTGSTTSKGSDQLSVHDLGTVEGTGPHSEENPVQQQHQGPSSVGSGSSQKRVSTAVAAPATVFTTTEIPGSRPETTRSHSFGSSSSNGGKQPGSVNSQGEGSQSSAVGSETRETRSEGGQKKKKKFHGNGHKQKGQSPAQKTRLVDGIASAITVTEGKGSVTGQKSNHHHRRPHNRGLSSSHAHQVVDSTSATVEEKEK